MMSFLHCLLALELLAVWPIYDHQTHEIRTWHIEINTMNKIKQVLIIDKPSFVFDARAFDQEEFDPSTNTIYLSPSRLGLVN